MILVEGNVVADLRKADAVLCGPKGRTGVYIHAQYGDRNVMLHVQAGFDVSVDQINDLAHEIASRKNKRGTFVVDPEAIWLTQVSD